MAWNATAGRFLGRKIEFLGVNELESLSILAAFPLPYPPDMHRNSPDHWQLNAKTPHIRGVFSVSVEGLEPPTNGLKGHCSTIELHAHLRVGFYHAGVL